MMGQGWVGRFRAMQAHIPHWAQLVAKAGSARAPPRLPHPLHRSHPDSHLVWSGLSSASAAGLSLADDGHEAWRLAGLPLQRCVFHNISKFCFHVSEGGGGGDRWRRMQTVGWLLAAGWVGCGGEPPLRCRAAPCSSPAPRPRLPACAAPPSPCRAPIACAGHGSQQRDPTGEELDGMNETLCPMDFQHVSVRGGVAWELAAVAAVHGL